ncbi:MAG: hypothetical protein ACRDP3_00190 [Streptomyces sp.]|uniref:hypothetical protein n=1 Tax=Streptomyces sp. TaxID=1931 RepID=UPI003D6A1D9D
MDAQREELRLAPWTSDEGKPCYLSTVPGGVLDGLADAVEAEQLADARSVLEHAREALSATGRALSAREAIWIATRLTESTGEVLRVADSRGMRLGGDNR